VDYTKLSVLDSMRPVVDSTNSLVPLSHYSGRTPGHSNLRGEYGPLLTGHHWGEV